MFKGRKSIYIISLASHEGCKAYRFYDKSNWVYFTNCSGETFKTDSTTSIRNRTERKQ